MFKSIYAHEMEEYFNMRSGILSKSAKAHELLYLKRFDSYISRILDTRGNINELCINGWISTLQGKSGSIENEIITIRQFLKYLGLSGECVYFPTIPKTRDDYQPYIFTDDELAKIFYSADNIKITKLTKEKYITIEFPVILRLLLSCGLRIGETVRINLSDVYFEDGILRLIKTKNQKQRLVPMTTSMTAILSEYCMVMGLYGKHSGWLFPSYRNNEEHIPDYTVKERFTRILRSNNIKLDNRKQHERGPCLHCLRHVFVFKSFSKGKENGYSIDQTVPYLSIFLGHDSLSETQKYMKFSNEMFPESIETFGSFIDDLLPEVNYEL